MGFDKLATVGKAVDDVHVLVGWGLFEGGVCREDTVGLVSDTLDTVVVGVD